MKLSLWQRIVFKINGCVFLRHEKREGWAGFLPIYLVKCSAHGLYEQYPQGYRENLPCPKCFEETIMGVKIK